MPDRTTQLIVFSDDWDRHPSSCQHLVRRLLPRYPTLWVNTIGTRRPRLSAEDVAKAAAKLRAWLRPGAAPGATPSNLTVIHPHMWPGFRSRWQRRLNAGSIRREVERALGPRGGAGSRLIAVTTLPLTADLVGALPGVNRWVYYCVDDFSVWPGLDGGVLRDMERQQVAKADALIAVSDTLVEHLSALGRPAALLTHGIDLAHWSMAPAEAAAGDRQRLEAARRALDSWAGGRRPIYLFWGVVDPRLDATWCLALADDGTGRASGAVPGQPGGGTLVLLGPQQSPDPRLAGHPRIAMPGPVPYDELPALALAADVLVMPYGDLPVTRAMQPLKFKEYLAADWGGAGRPVVVRNLPSTQAWADCADVVDSAEAFVRLVGTRAVGGVPAEQRDARRRRLPDETWDRKAEMFEKLVVGNRAGMTNVETRMPNGTAE